MADRSRRRQRQRDGAGRALRGHDGHRAGALLQHAGAAEVPAHRGDRVGPLRGGVPPHRARASGRRLHAAAQRPRRAPSARAGPARARAGAAGRRLRRGRGAGRRAGGSDRHRRIRGAPGLRDARGGTILVRQRPLRARPDALARAARRLPRRAAPRPAAGVRAVADARPAPGRRQRPPAEDRGAVPRIGRGARLRAQRHRARARDHRRGAARGLGGRAARHRRRAHAAIRSRRRTSGDIPPLAPVPVREWRADDDAARRDGAGRLLREALRPARAGWRADAGAAGDRRRPSARIRARAIARRSTSSRRIAPASCWSTCTRRTSGSSTSA